MVLIRDIPKKALRRFRRLLFSLIILLATCPLSGQANKIEPPKQVGFHDALEVQVRDNQIFLGMDTSLFGKEMLFVVHGKQYKHVRWKPYRNHIVLQAPKVKSLSGTLIPQSQDPEIQKETLGLFPILDKKGPRTVYLNVSELFLHSPLTTSSSSSASEVNGTSFFEEVKLLKDELVIGVKKLMVKGGTQYFETVYYSLYLLKDLMQPRWFDHRMGFFAEDENSFINHFPKHAKACIARWRLEKQNRNKEVSEPIRPITFYFGPEVPEKWKPYIKAGIMEWAPAFEAAGFKDALEVRERPKGERDWSVHSLQYSLIRWPNKKDVRRFSSDHGSTVNKVTDLRSGEILKADIIIGSSYEDLMDNYFVRCAPMDPRAWQYPFPDDLMGELIQSLVAHEAGHAFGIKDAHYGEYTYPFEKMRDREWLKIMGHTPSIMSYARHNHIVQPEDGIPPSLLIQKVGPMDMYQIQWGYGTFDKNGLEGFIRLQDSIPWYRYNLNKFEILGPGSGNEVADNDDPVSSAELGLGNLKKVLELLPKVTRYEKDNVLMERLYNKTLELWYQEMEQVLTLVGGYTIQYKSGDQKGPVYNPIPREQQIGAMEFLGRNAFKIPDWLSHPEFSPRIRYSSSNGTLLNYQMKLLKEIISLYRSGRIEQMERSGGPYKELLKSILVPLREGLFKGMVSENVLDLGRWDLQRAYIFLLMEGVGQDKQNLESNGSVDNQYSGYTQSVLLSELALLKSIIENSLEHGKGGMVRAHLKLCLESLNTF